MATLSRSQNWLLKTPKKKKHCRNFNCTGWLTFPSIAKPFRNVYVSPTVRTTRTSRDSERGQRKRTRRAARPPTGLRCAGQEFFLKTKWRSSNRGNQWRRRGLLLQQSNSNKKFGVWRGCRLSNVVCFLSFVSPGSFIRVGPPRTCALVIIVMLQLIALVALSIYKMVAWRLLLSKNIFHEPDAGLINRDPFLQRELQEQKLLF